MAGTIPCPMCGSDVASESPGCGVCGYAFARSSPSNIGGLKCARCGSPVENGFDFCPICGQNQRERFARPDTRIIQVDADPLPPDRTVAAPPGGPAPPVGVVMPPAVMMPPAVAVPTPAVMPGVAAAAPVAAAMPPPLLTMPGATPPMAPMPAQTGATQFADGPPLPRPPGFDAPPPSSGVDRTVAAPAVLRRPEVDEADHTIPVPPGRSRPAIEAPAHPPATEDAPTTAFDPRQLAAAVAIAQADQARRGEEQTREGVQPMGPWSKSSPSQPVVGARGQSSAPTNPGSQTPRLVLVGRDGSEGDKFAVVGDRLTIGRRSADVLFADDDFLSPTHARIERQGDHYWLVDTGSQNGVFLRIHGTSPIYPGDSFMVGHQLLRVENVDGPTEEQPPDELGTRLFGTPLQPAWGKLAVLGRGGIRGDAYGLRGARLVIGRESGDIIFPNDPFLSREHARLRLELNGATMSVFLEDLNSANGTYIRIRGAAELHNRDTFRIGDQIIRLRLD